MNHRIENYPAFTAVGMKMRYKGNKDIPGLWEAFVPRMREVHNIDDSDRSFGVMGNYDQATGEFDYLAGVPVSSATEIPAGMDWWDVPEQTYAVFCCTLQTLGETFDQIYREWLPASPYIRSNGPEFELYDQSFRPEEGKFAVTIWVPVWKKVKE